MELQHKQIEAIADNVQTVLNNELQSISKYKELENKFNITPAFKYWTSIREMI